MFSMFDPLMDFRCPHCDVSLRFRCVRMLSNADPKILNPPYICPLCKGTMTERRHPAIANAWLWSRFYMPGVLLCTLGTFVPSLGWILPYALVALAVGFFAIVVYMVRERWGWKRYVPYQQRT